ncbi:MAG: serine hydrolase [Planctomycetes bacterium]|nr:serine hydrolase [Planctomycetota bacterium]MBI3844041.1 serine hydrolase [Planctomycetota bacterium]
MKACRTRAFVLVSTLLLLDATAHGQSPFPNAKPEDVGVSTAALESMVREVRRWVDDGEAVGAEIHVIKNRKTILHEGIGWKDREEKKAMEPGTIFCVRSMTKPLVGTAVQMLIDEGKLALSDRASKFLPSFDNDKSRTITVEHLLTHTAGFRYTTMDKGLDGYKSLRDVADQAGGIGPSFEPGSKFSYSDTDTETLAAIVAVITGQPAETFIQKRLLDPVGMSDTFPVLGADRPDRARVSSNYGGTVGSWEKYWLHTDPPFFKYFLGAQSGYSTTTDYARFLAMWMDGGRVGDRRLLSDAAVRRALTPSKRMLMPGDPPGETPEFPTTLPPGKISYGQHWMIWADDAKPGAATLPTFGHGGSDGTTAIAFPDKDLIVCYFTQSRGGVTVMKFEDLVLPLLGLAAPKVAAVKRPTNDELAAYVGGYHDESEDSYPFVVMQGDRLAAEIPGNGLLVLDWPNADGRWKLAAAPNVSITFERDAAGAVSSMTVEQGDARRTMPRMKPAADLPTVDAVMALRHDKGGAEKIDRLRRLRYTGKIEIAAAHLSGDITIIADGPDRAVTRVTWAGGFEDTIVDRDKAWKLRPNAAPEAQDATLLEASRLSNPIAKLGDWRKSFSKLEVARKDKVGDAEVWALRLTPASLPTSTRYVSVKDGTVLREDSWIPVKALGMVPVITRFDDFRIVGGIPIAHHYVSDRGPRLGMVTVQFDKVEIDPDIPADAFALEHKGG